LHDFLKKSIITLLLKKGLLDFNKNIDQPRGNTCGYTSCPLGCIIYKRWI